jgi:hypothetical protein
MAKINKVDLTLLKKLIGELEISLATADTIKSGVATTNNHDYIIEMAKAAGLAAGTMQEAALIVSDISVLTAGVQGPAAVKSGDFLDKLLGIKSPDKN